MAYGASHLREERLPACIQGGAASRVSCCSRRHGFYRLHIASPGRRVTLCYHFDKEDMKKPDWLDHVNTYNLKLKLAFAIISISGVHALKTYLSGELTLENIQIVTMVAVIHFTFVLSAMGISFAERMTRAHK